ncbi:hypothetical protein PtA15_7A640 [Puccinia triticina]|uniref:Uncharacterized protein n=1 Tax=Puccinia triticina TaxID=208348 RepID=A0ABY7CNT8_9BASI|nr:uncharacterized protein PtA15_7A640 [Puccinia triticina]WAQ86911.1 hypothetical protein PtA15_7A640 [Puccinia triticina]
MLNLPRSRSSTGSSCGFHDLPQATLLRPSDAESSKQQHAGRRLSKMRNMISSTLTKSNSHYPLQPSNYTQTLPTSRPKVRRTISRSMIAPLQHLFGVEHHDTELEEAERYENQPWSLTLSKANTSRFSRRGPTAVLYQPTLSDDEEWDFRCQGMAPVIPARPSEDALSPSSAYKTEDLSRLYLRPSQPCHPKINLSSSRSSHPPDTEPIGPRSQNLINQTLSMAWF